jgi:hypothetical protein
MSKHENKGKRKRAYRGTMPEKEFREVVERSMRAIREKITESEPKCVSCGKSEFRLTRMVDSQILAECIHCGEPHTLDAIDVDTRKPTNLQWFSPKMEERE